ncbi:MAG: ThiF family adenylyltransferase [Verrucomicrobia bacterium]|nr:ThiF family adenylyltransferase [Verrucomicrobiota bacterium]
MKKFILAPYVRVGFLEGTLHFGFGSLRQLIVEREMQDCVLDAAVFLKQSRNMEEIACFLEGAGHAKGTIQGALDVLLRNFLIPEGSYDREERHSRNFLFYALSGAEVEKIQRIISSKKVAIVGCGGIGNVVGVMLATAGVGEFILVDNDHIELSNLGRQIMFKEADCGRYKTTALAEGLKERSSLAKVTEIKEFISKDNVHELQNVDFIVLSGDQENIVDVVNTFSIKHGIPFMNIGYIEDIAVWGPLVVPGKSGCCCCKEHLVSFNDLTQDQIDKCKEINRRYQAPSTGPINMIASSFAALDIIKFLGNFGQVQSLNTRIGIWSHDLHIEKQDYSLNPSCEVCGSLQKVK